MDVAVAGHHLWRYLVNYWRHSSVVAEAEHWTLQRAEVGPGVANSSCLEDLVVEATVEVL